MPGIPVLHGRADLTASGPCGLGATVRALLQGMGFSEIGPRVAKLWAMKTIGPLAFDEMPVENYFFLRIYFRSTFTHLTSLYSMCLHKRRFT